MFLHELGHALIAFMAGGKARITMHRKTRIPYGETSKKSIIDYIYPKGACQVKINKTLKDSPIFWLVFFLSGVIAQLIFLSLIIILSLLQWGYILEILKLFIVVNGMIIFDALIPKVYKDGYHSDGKQILNIIKQIKKS